MHIKQDDAATDYKTLQNLADSFLAVDDLNQAQQYYEKAATLDADEPAPYVGLGIIALRNNRPDDAQLAFRVACRLDPRCSKSYEGLAMIAQKKGDCETAFQMYLKCLELDTNNLAALLGLFQTSSRMGSFAKIIHYLEVYLKMHPDDCSVMFSLATLYIKEDRLGTSKTMLLKILESEPDNKDAAHLLEEVEQNLARTIAL